MGEQHPYFAPMDTASTDPKMGSATPPALGHSMSPTDPDNPQNWPTAKKVYASSVSAAFTFAVYVLLSKPAPLSLWTYSNRHYGSAFGLTSTTVGIQGVMMRFNVSMTVAILPLSLFLLGVFFAPIITPHLSERLGRSPVYFISLPLFALFILGAGLSKSLGSLAICRFFAGFFGGPCLVLIEGTFADVWPAQKTVTYYSFLSLASYIGAGSGQSLAHVGRRKAIDMSEKHP